MGWIIGGVGLMVAALGFGCAIGSRAPLSELYEIEGAIGLLIAAVGYVGARLQPALPADRTDDAHTIRRIQIAVAIALAVAALGLLLLLTSRAAATW